MHHPFMAEVADRLAAARIATLRYQFPFMQQGGRRPNGPAVCHATVRAAVALATKRMPSVPLIAGGKSFGGRMTSQAQALEPLPRVVGLAFLGFPWHPPKAPSRQRSEHLAEIRVPMLFLQGTRDVLGDSTLIRGQMRKLRRHATLHRVGQADHGFHVPVASGRDDDEVQDELVRIFSQWLVAADLLPVPPTAGKPRTGRRRPARSSGRSR